ncbi:MAG TPA: DUF3419 domain-containing protein, partial [Bacteroidia bacterium]|nr:DUF3419 domain-containing protein [Bacteroidia bacterium]
IKEYGTFQCMNLSNIFEYMNPALFEQTAKTLVAGTEPGGRLAYWNLMVPRRISAILPRVKYQQGVSEQLTREDNGFFYNQFIIDQVQ